MSNTQSTSDSAAPEFYAPATFQFAATPGRAERAVARLLRRRGAMDGHPRATVATREFYAPATFQFSARPGRVERLTGRAFHRRGAMDGRPRGEQGESPFYAPATTRDAFTGRGRRPEGR